MGHHGSMEPPRSLDQRKADALAKLEALGSDLWLASSSSSGQVHLVPLSFAWDGERVIIATEARSATVRNISDTHRARLALGSTRDVVMIDVVPVGTVAVPGAPVETAECYATQADWDPRTEAGDYVYVHLLPERIQVWREADEIEGRTVMQRGLWLV